MEVNQIKEDFLFGYNLAEQRVIMARKRNHDVFNIREWMRREKHFIEEENVGRKLVHLMGVVVGNYTTFCLTQFQLDSFDNTSKLVKSYLQS